LNRGRARTNALSTDWFSNGRAPDFIPGRYTVFSGTNLPFQIAPGYDAVVERYLGRDANNYDWSIQGGFRGFNNWVASGTVDSTSQVTDIVGASTVTHGGLNSFFGGEFVGLDWADRQTARYVSEFDSAELNMVLRPHPRSDRIVLYPNGQWVRESQPGFYWSFLAGVRYFNVDEEFTFRGAGSYTQRDLGGAVIGQGLLSGTYFAHTSNGLVGLNFGTEAAFRGKGWELGFHFKASPMINTAVAASHVDTSDPIVGGSGDQHASYRFAHTNAAAILELGVLGTYRLSDHWALRGGYDMDWLTGAAFAPAQRPSANQVKATGTVFFQGLGLGMEYRR
jgi:hypothetical protein